jgi:hypothetical protein
MSARQAADLDPRIDQIATTLADSGTHTTPSLVPTPLDVQLRRASAPHPTTAHGWTERLNLPPLTHRTREERS